MENGRIRSVILIISEGVEQDIVGKKCRIEG
jgi:hypothetical protein